KHLLKKSQFKLSLSSPVFVYGSEKQTPKPKQKKKKGRTMNPLTQFKRILILPLLIALTLVALASPASATLPPGNTVQQWNKIAEDTVVGSGTFQPEGFIYMAYAS